MLHYFSTMLDTIQKNWKENIYSNTMLFLPPNTTSKLQPLDAGITWSFKVHYKTLLLPYVLSKIDQTTVTAADILKSVNVLKAIRWVAKDGVQIIERPSYIKKYGSTS